MDLRGRGHEHEPEPDPYVCGDGLLQRDANSGQCIRGSEHQPDDKYFAVGNACRLLHIQSCVADSESGGAVHGHIDGLSDFLAMDLWGRGYEHDPEPDPHV
jgi:hypothetical protein